MTFKQKRLLDFIQQFQKDNDGVSPSFAEMMKAVGYKSKSGIYRLLLGLEEQGYIRRLPNRARAIQVSPAPTMPPLSGIGTGELLEELTRRGVLHFTSS